MLFAAVHASAEGRCCLLRCMRPHLGTISALDGPHRGKLSFSQLLQLGVRGAMEAQISTFEIRIGAKPGRCGYAHFPTSRARARFCDVVPVWGIDDEKEIVI